ncbi:MAG: YHS domain-containing protein [Candidatus Margulisiibacteriota bacterium]
MKNLKYCLGLLLAMFLFSQVLAEASTHTMKGLKQPLPVKKEVAKKLPRLVECPVTKTKIDPAKTKLKTVYKGTTYYFCCPGCPEEFKKNPGKYAK